MIVVKAFNEHHSVTQTIDVFFIVFQFDYALKGTLIASAGGASMIMTLLFCLAAAITVYPSFHEYSSLRALGSLSR